MAEERTAHCAGASGRSPSAAPTRSGIPVCSSASNTLSRCASSVSIACCAAAQSSLTLARVCFILAMDSASLARCTTMSKAAVLSTQVGGTWNPLAASQYRPYPFPPTSSTGGICRVSPSSSFQGATSSCFTPGPPRYPCCRRRAHAAHHAPGSWPQERRRRRGGRSPARRWPRARSRRPAR